MKALLSRIAAIAAVALGLIAYGIANDPIPPPECPPGERDCAK